MQFSLKDYWQFKRKIMIFLKNIGVFKEVVTMIMILLIWRISN